MRALAFVSAAAAVCVCCALPSFDAVDVLPGPGGDSASAGSPSQGGALSPSSAMGGKPSAGSGNGADGGDQTDPGEGGSDGMGGSSTPGGLANGGSNAGSSGSAGSSPGGSGGSAGANMGGSAGSGGSGTTAAADCMAWCAGANGVVSICQDYLVPDVATLQLCMDACITSPADSLVCWRQHLVYVVDAATATYHCPHAVGSANNGVCPSRI